MSEEQTDAGGVTEGGAQQASEGQDQQQQPDTLLSGAQAPEGQGQQDAAEGNGQKDDAEGNEETDEDKVPEGAPEKYDDFRVPEGMTMDSEVGQAFEGVARELNLSQAQAQTLIDKVSPVLAQRSMARIQEISNEWAERSRSDKEIGGENHARCMADVARLRDKFAVNADGQVDPDIAEFMNSPMGNHPGALKLFARAGRAFGEAGFPQGSPAKRTYTADDVYS